MSAVLAGLLAVACGMAPPRGDPPLLLGLYGVPVAACSLAAAAGFTVVQDYSFETGSFADPVAFTTRARAYLDRAHAHGLRVLLGLPREWLRGRREAALREAVRDLRDHPAILAWYEDEIGQGGDVEAVLLEARVVAEEDPEHGLVIEESSRDERLRSIARARMFTYYPVTSAARAAGRWQTLPERFPVRDLAVPFWPVLQAFGRELVSGSPHHDLLVPTPDELRFSLHSAIAAGAAGIFFYPYMHATRYDGARAAAGSWAYFDYRPLPEVAPGLWRAVLDCRSLASELLELRRGAEPAALRVLPPADVEVRGWTTRQGLLVVAANAGREARRVEIRVEPRQGRVQPLSGRAAATGAEPGWTFTGHSVRLEIPGPGGIAVLVRPSP